MISSRLASFAFAIALFSSTILSTAADNSVTDGVVISPAGSGGVSTNAIIPGDGICIGSSNSPHYSSHVAGTVNAEGRTSCPFAYPDEYVNSTFYADGLLYDSQDAESFARYRTLSVFVNTDCFGYDVYYEIDSYHFVEFPSGSVGEAYSNNNAHVDC